MSDDSESVRHEIEQLLDGLRQDLVNRSVTLYREHFAEDANVLAMDDPQVYRGKERCLDYVRRLGQQSRIQSLEAEMEDLKLIGDVAIVIERSTVKYEVRGQTYHDTGRATWVLVKNRGRWLVTHSHLESMAPNRIVERAP